METARKRFHLLASRGCGSVVVEAAFLLADIAYEREEVDYESEAGRARLREFNPLAQVPTLIAPNGTVLSETAAIVLHVSELAPDAELAPQPLDPKRPEFLRWLMFLVTALYGTFTYGDDPQKWVGEHGALLRQSTDLRREELWRYLETHVVKGPWFLGDRFSALDLYAAVMVRWRPRRTWFAEHCPRVLAIAEVVETHPRLAAMWSANFPD